MTPRTRVIDGRPGMGAPTGQVEIATLAIPERCHALCSWVVVVPGLGWRCVSRLKYSNSLCGHHRKESRG